jgi:hypothetical protein
MASHGLKRKASDLSQDLVVRLERHLSHALMLDRIISELNRPTRQALADLAQADGHLPAHTFFSAFGQYRPYRPRKKGAETIEPWLNPISPTETLYFSGLIYPHPRRPQTGQVQEILIPSDLLDPIKVLMQTPQTSPTAQLRQRPGHPPDLAWHVALLLTTLNHTPVRPIHERWLPPRILHALAQRTGFDRQQEYTPTRSERNLPYLAFLHYLTEAAGLVGGRQQLAITPRGWQWLAADTPTRWQTLWQTWLSSPTDIAIPYHFPWADLSPKARAWVGDQLRQRLPSAYQDQDAFIRHLHLLDSDNLLSQPWNLQEDIVATLVEGPLFWMNVLNLTEPIDPATEPALALSPHGAWLLLIPDHQAPSFPTPEPCQTLPTDNTSLRIGPNVQPLHLARLAPFCQWPQPPHPTSEQHLQLTEETISSAIARGEQLPQILHTLRQACGRSPSERLTRKLRRWSHKGLAVRLRHITILETDTPTLMGQLRSRKHIRRHLDQPLSPTRSLANPAQSEALARHLHTLGWQLNTASLDFGLSKTPGIIAPPQTDDNDPAAISSPDLALLWMAALLYQKLGQHIPLPASLPYELQERITAQLSQTQIEAAEFLSQQAADALAAALRGYLGFPAWMDHERAGNPLPIIEKAIHNGHDLNISYWSAGAERRLERHVTPYWLEKHGETPYLVAYCHLRHAERVFRLDRILACEILA